MSTAPFKLLRPMKQSIRFLVFDVESVADGDLVSELRYPAQQLSAKAAIAQYRAELLETTGKDFVPYTYQVPISVVVAKVRDDYVLDDVVALDEPEFRSYVMTERFWRGWELYQRPTLVSFNGRSFDIPLLELSAFRYGISVPAWFDESGRSWEQPRNRYNTTAHLDLQDLLVNYGATRFNGGLNLAANLLGKPGKMEVQGDMVQQLYDAGQLTEINDYCRCDVLDTYFVFLRTRVLLGKITLAREQELVVETKEWLKQRALTMPVYTKYLDNWRDWENPWPTDGAPS